MLNIKLQQIQILANLIQKETNIQFNFKEDYKGELKLIDLHDVNNKRINIIDFINMLNIILTRKNRFQHPNC